MRSISFYLLRTWLAAMLVCASVYGEQNAATHDNSNAIFEHFGIGFEESGLLLRIRALSFRGAQPKPRLLTLGGAFRLVDQQNMLHSDLYEFHAKIGVIRELTRNPRARPGIFLEALAKRKEFETEEPLIGQVRYPVYPIWGFKARLGMIISMYPARRLCISFRFGAEVSYYTPPYILNDSKTALEQFGDGAWTAGACGYETNPLEMFVNNLGIHVTF
jgi:hypothetical protein